MHDRVATTTIKREWVVPGVNDPASGQLDLATSILGGLGSSRLDNALVRKEKTAVSVSAGVQEFENVSFLTVSADVKPGADPAVVSKRLDEIIAEFLKNGPTADEVNRAATSEVANTIKGLEQVGGFGGKAVTLAEGEVYSKDPAKYKKDLEEIAAATPASVTEAARRWMGRPALRLTIEPGPRSAEDIALSGSVVSHPRYFRSPSEGGAPAPGMKAPVTKHSAASSKATEEPTAPRIAEPPVLPVKPLQFPPIERTTLSNGIKVVFARRNAVPTVNAAINFDAGNAADDKAKLGTEALYLSLVEEGTSRARFRRDRRRSGASWSEHRRERVDGQYDDQPVGA